MKKIFSCILSVVLVASMSGCASTTGTATSSSEEEETVRYDNEVDIVLDDSQITVDGEAVSEDEQSAVYIANDVIYYEDRDTYDDGYTYGEGTDADKHTAEEAEATTVVHITQPGTYRISGTLSAGQIAVDLGDDAKIDEEAKVTLVLDNADITCTVAPAVIFYSVYECDTDWVAYDNGDTDTFEATSTVDTSAAGANIILVDGSVNNISGAYVAKIYKDQEEEKKLYKYDGAFYSRMSMNINGEEEGTGILNITATNEGLDSEHHLTINGGVVHITSNDDGINTNEDGVSVTTINGGELHIVAGLGSEGDGVDSNGYLVINGGIVISMANPASDSGLDSDMGSYINGGTVIATGSTMDWAESDSAQVTMNVQFAQAHSSTDAIVITDTEGKVIFAYDPEQDETTGSNARDYQGAIISTSGLVTGNTYYLYVGGDVTGTEVNGLYDPDTVTEFTGTRQTYNGNSVGMGGMNPGNMDENFDPNSAEMPEAPEGFDPNSTEMPEGFEGEKPDDFDPDSTEMPEGFNPAQAPEKPEGEEGTDGQTPPDMPQTGENSEAQQPADMPQGTPGNMPQGGFDPTGAGTFEASPDFVMEDQVNAFSGVQDEVTE